MGEKKLIILVFRQRLGKVPQCPNLSTCQQATRERQKRRALMCPWPSRSSSSRSEPPPATICTVVEVKREVWCMLTLCDTLQIRVKKNIIAGFHCICILFQQDPPQQRGTTWSSLSPTPHTWWLVRGAGRLLLSALLSWRLRRRKNLQSEKLGLFWLEVLVMCRHFVLGNVVSQQISGVLQKTLYLKCSGDLIQC